MGYIFVPNILIVHGQAICIKFICLIFILYKLIVQVITKNIKTSILQVFDRIENGFVDILQWTE